MAAGSARGSTRDAWIEHNLRQSQPAQRAPDRAHDRRAAGPVHQGRPADHDHDELPARGVPPRARGAAGRGAAAPVRGHRGAHPRGARQVARRAVRAVRAPADRVGVDRPGPPRAAPRRHARSRSRCSTPTSRRSCAATSTRCAASSASSSGSSRTRASRSSIARSARSCSRSSTSAPRPTNAARIAANFEGRTDVGVPARRRELSTARVLTTHFEAGVKITDKRGVKQLGLDRGQLARQVVEIYCQQIFTDGVYHADPHPGNLLVRPASDGGAADDRVPRLRRGRRDSRRTCAPASSS